MMKRVIASLALALPLALPIAAHAAIQPIYAPAPPIQQSPFDGFYVGLHGGYNWFSSKLDGNTVVDAYHPVPADLGAPISLGTVKEPYDHTLNHGGGLIGAQIGGGYVFDHNFYLGAELNGEYQDAKGSYHFSTTKENEFLSATINNSVKSQLKESFGVTLHPGILVNPQILIYGVVGYELGHVKYESTYKTDVEITPLGGLPVKESFVMRHNGHKNLNGLRLGLGVSYMVGHHVSVGAEYLYTHYFGSIKDYQAGLKEVKSSDFPGPVDVTVDNHIKLSSFHTNAIMFNVAYHFG